MIEYIEFGTNDAGQLIYARVDEDKLIRFTCTAENPEYQEWLKEKSK